MLFLTKGYMLVYYLKSDIYMVYVVAITLRVKTISVFADWKQ